ncbi:MAG: hypothetical protein UX49_C0012G0001, partial [Candidatus Wolfebacteria bacterium GW2011_GWC2_46_275]
SGSSSVVERLLAKEEVAGSSPVYRSRHKKSPEGDFLFLPVLPFYFTGFPVFLCYNK